MLFIIGRILMELTKWNKIYQIKKYLNYVMMIKKQNILATLMIFLSQQKLLWKNFIPTWQPPKLPLLKCLAKFLTKRKFHLNLQEVTKSINTQTNKKSSGNHGLTAELYKHCSNELSPMLLDVYDFWEKFDIIGVSSRTGVISVTYIYICNRYDSCSRCKSWGL